MLIALTNLFLIFPANIAQAPDFSLAFCKLHFQSVDFILFFS